MDFTQLTYELDGPLALIGLNRPGKRNAISITMIAELQSAVLRAGREARVGVLHGHGGHFSAGLDLAEQLNRTPLDGIANSRLWHRVFDDIERGGQTVFVETILKPRADVVRVINSLHIFELLLRLNCRSIKQRMPVFEFAEHGVRLRL